MNVESYSFSLSQSDNDLKLVNMEARPSIILRPRRLITNVMRQNEVLIEQIYFDEESQLIGPVDAYQWSRHHADEVRLAFMHEHNLLTMTELDNFCEDNDIDVPDPTKVTLPTMKKGCSIKFTGKLLDVSKYVAPYLFIAMFIGEARVQP